MFEYEITKNKKIIFSAMMLALLIVLSRFLSLKTNLLVISFSFIPIMISAIYLGPNYSMLIAGLGDLIGAILFPFGSYFPGFTISAALSGFIYGVFLYKDPNKKISNLKFIIRLIISSLIVLILIKIFIESVFLNILYGKAYLVVVTTRISTQLVLFPIQVALIFGLEKALNPFAKKYLYKSNRIGIDEYLNKFDKFTKNPNLEAMKYLTEKFNNPQKKLNIIHVAGTNGKGSICEMLSSVLTSQGYKVGKFISPHLIRFNDGILINNIEISDEEVEEIIIPLSIEIENYNKTHKIPVKWFEVITSLVLIYFAKNNCDFVVLETGLGGKNDCTNIVDSMISIIAKIGYDHVDILGKSIKDITEHKAGIIKPNTDTIFVNQAEATDIIKKTCNLNNTNLHLIERTDITNFSYDNELQSFSYKEYKNIEINLKGKEQIYNAAEVLECIDILKEKGYKISDDAIRKGLKNIIHKARMEKIYDNPEIIFDGAHNDSAILNLKANIKQYYDDKERVYIISILKTKDYKTVIKKIVEDKNAIFIFTDGNSKKRYVSKRKLYKVAENYIENKNNLFIKEFEEAIQEVIKEYKNKRIFIIGSFYVYKNAINLLGEKNDKN